MKTATHSAALLVGAAIGWLATPTPQTPAPTAPPITIHRIDTGEAGFAVPVAVGLTSDQQQPYVALIMETNANERDVDFWERSEGAGFLKATAVIYWDDHAYREAVRKVRSTDWSNYWKNNSGEHRVVRTPEEYAEWAACRNVAARPSR